nr:hypothetical protein SYMBAF_180028 [Serratia symbiotica]
MNGMPNSPAPRILQSKTSHPDGTVNFALPASQQTSVHRGGEMLSSCEAPQVSDLFAAYAGLIYISLPPHTSFLVSPSMSC